MRLSYQRVSSLVLSLALVGSASEAAPRTAVLKPRGSCRSRQPAATHRRSGTGAREALAAPGRHDSRTELKTGKQVGGKSHLQKGAETIRGLKNWLRDHPKASKHDIAAPRTN